MPAVASTLEARVAALEAADVRQRRLIAVLTGRLKQLDRKLQRLADAFAEELYGRYTYSLEWCYLDDATERDWALIYRQPEEVAEMWAQEARDA